MLSRLRSRALVYPNAFVKHPVDTIRSLNSQLRHTNPIEGLPYMCWDAIDFLSTTIEPGSRVFEYGSGGSTIFVAGRGAELVSIEHDASWYTKVKSRLAKRKLDTVDYRLVPPLFKRVSCTGNDQYESSREAFTGMSFRNYVETINEFPDSYFDLLLIDGRARVGCAQVGLCKVRSGGYVVLDNSKRPQYSEIWALMRDFYSVDFTGMDPLLRSYTSFIAYTTAWKIGPHKE